MDIQLATSLLTGGFTLGAGIVGAVLAGVFARRGEDRRHKAEVGRQWLTDRRAVYAKYLALAEVMQRQIDAVAVFLSYDGVKEIEAEDDELISVGLIEYITTWEDDLQPLLGELQLVATQKVADLADRVSGALMEMTVFLERRQAFTAYYPMWFQSQDLIHVLRNEMRADLGLASQGETTRSTTAWPWLESRPPYESYIQNHPEQGSEPSHH
jgi:hypothetical protein